MNATILNYANLNESEKETARRAAFAHLLKHKGLYDELHKAYSFDFEKPFEMFRHCEPFTFNQLRKLFDTSGGVLIVLFKWAYIADHYRVVYITESEEISGGRFTWASGLDTFNTKKDLTEARKTNADAYIIYQSAENLTPATKPAALDFSNDRFRLDRGPITGVYNNYRYISQADFKTLDGTRAFNYRAFGMIVYTAEVYRKPENIEALIDKSGYINYYKRDELKRKAAALRAERKQAEIKKYDFTREITKAAAAFEKKRDEVMETAANALTYEEISAAQRAIYSLQWIALDYERFIKRVKNSEYNSIESAAAAFENLINKIGA